MKLWQKWGFLVVIVVLVVLAVMFWGSIFCGAIVLGLIMCLPVYLYNRFLLGEEEKDFMEDDNG